MSEFVVAMARPSMSVWRRSRPSMIPTTFSTSTPTTARAGKRPISRVKSSSSPRGAGGGRGCETPGDELSLQSGGDPAGASASSLGDVSAYGGSHLGGEASQLGFHVAFEPEDESVHTVLEGELGELALADLAADIVQPPPPSRLPAGLG